MKELLGEQPQVFDGIKIWLSMSGGGMALIDSKAGCGKTFLTGEIVEYIYQTKITRVAITALTNKAVKVLRQFVRNDATTATTHSILGMKEYIEDNGNLSFKKDPMAPCKADNFRLLIVDEASMVPDVIFDELARMVYESNMKVLFVGDSYQIPPVGQEYAMPFEKEVQIEHNIKVFTMNTIIRQATGSPIPVFAATIRENIHKPVQIFNPQEVKNAIGGVFPIKRPDELHYFVENILPMYKSKNYEIDIDHIKIVAWTNKVVNFYNKIVREYLFGENLPNVIIGDKLIMDAPVFDGDKIVIGTNEEVNVLDLDIEEEKLSDEFILQYYKVLVQVFKGGLFDEYIIKIIHEDSQPTYDKIIQLQKKVALSYPKGSFQSKSAWIDLYRFKEKWAQVKYCYAITGHKAQSSTYENTFVVTWDILKNPIVFERNRILYTACTRPSKNLYIVY